MAEFYQDGPELGNQYTEDNVLLNYLARVLPPALKKSIEPGLVKWGAEVVERVLDLGRLAESHPPRHIPYDPWGRRIDAIEVSEAWTELAKIAAAADLVGTAYRRREKEFSRIHQFAKIYLFGSSSAIYTCPLAMSDGAARAIELYADGDLKKEAFAKLISSDPENFWTSGQWMTERTGGSDVSLTSTVARREGLGYRLYGTKWFTSATTSEMAMTLARIEEKPGEAEAGSRGLSLFFVKLRDEKNNLQQIQIHRLKEKMGTHALPTAELTMNGTPAVLIGEPGAGVKKISRLFNITRVWNSVIAVSFMRRGLALARSYARKRKAFGKLLSEHPLHVETLAALQTRFEGSFHLAFKLAELVGREETGMATEQDRAALRLLTPVVKLFTAKEAIAVCSEILESFGGAGYIEDTGLPPLLRDAQVLSIWEGTTNVLSLDVLRAIEKEKVLEPCLDGISTGAKKLKSPALAGVAEKIRGAVESLKKFDRTEASARRFAYSIARTYGALFLAEQAQWDLDHGSGPGRSTVAAKRWSETELVTRPFDSEDDGGEHEGKRGADSLVLFQG